MGSVSAALQPRSQPDRDGLLKTQGSSARQSCPNNRRTLQSHRTNLLPVPTRRVQKLFQRRRIRIQLNVRRSRLRSMVSAKNDGLSEETGRTHLFGKSWAN